MIMKDKLNRLDAILHELQLDEYLNEDSLPKIGEARGLVNELVKNCSIPVVSSSFWDLVYGVAKEFVVFSDREKGIVEWTIRCLANPLNPLSEKVLEEIKQQREKVLNGG